ncbi:ABC transporter permease [Marinobacter nanhaiticus D15-8W]|uniref:ABC transporter permease n=1 Tax=Marinobacter nanhaiticus D15-8W TaxID=626887 RepID=N6X198_9GAMM|nr:ABC transporter permease [Marinobacter nanhaiticus]ENO14863.1 ABC transporter permease [Marinobacter nanhaiticus D15-8W]BES69443.1 ABC transporter permease [Marinobacter nanhaiticus D15-8W]
MSIELITNILAATVVAGTPLLIVALGELICERSGVLNLGQEGMMLIGAVAGFIAVLTTGSLTIGVIAAMAAGVAMALLFALMAVTLAANQYAAGLALTIFGTGLSAFIGAGYVGKTIDGFTKLAIPGLSDIPVLGPVLFNQDLLVYVSLGLFVAVYVFLRHSRGGLLLRAVGESPDSANANGLPVMLIRYLAVSFGGAMAGLAGAYLSLAYTPLWTEGMTAGRGWIALALVVFATWRPERVLLGAYLFGVASILHLVLQGFGWDSSTELLAMLPYVVTIVVLVLLSSNPTRTRLHTPLSLGQPYRPGR